MRRSPRRPLILKRRKLPFQQDESTPAESHQATPGSKDAPAGGQSFPDGVRFIGHPSLTDTQVVVVPKAADLQGVIGALTAKGKESGVQGPSKFILLSDNGNQNQGSFCEASSADGEVIPTPASFGELVAEEIIQKSLNVTGIKPLSKDSSGGPLDDSLTNIQWLGKMSTCTLEPEPPKQINDEENQSPMSQTLQSPSTPTETKVVRQPLSARPPYSYMAMIQFAINSRKNRRMTLKEIYMWIEEHFPYYRQVAKPGWKNSIRHNLSLHDMFVRETAPDGKVSFWTIRPEANRCLTLDQVYRPQKRIVPDGRKLSSSTERRMKPLLPRTDSYLVPIQLPVASPVYLPSFTCSQQKPSGPRAAKRVRISPKVTQSDVSSLLASPATSTPQSEVKEEPMCVPLKCETPKGPTRRPASSSRRKQRLVNSTHEEPVLLCPETTFFDSGIISDASTFHDVRDAERELPHLRQDSPDRELSFKTPIKGGSHLTSSTPSKPSPSSLEPWRVNSAGKGGSGVLDVSPIRTPGGPAVTPTQDYTTFSLSSTPFKDVPLFSSPRELLTCCPARAESADSPLQHPRGGCSRELLQGGGATQANRSLTEGFMLDILNDSLSKILVDISFSGLEDEDLGMANISLSDFINQLK